MKIVKDTLQRLIEHAKKDAPIEACGYLAAKDDIVVKHYALTNVDQSPEHFSFDPKEQFAVLRAAREQKLDIYAVYHSHPASPPRPSAEDIKLAYDASLRYVIISLLDGHEDVQSFKIVNRTVEPEKIEVVSDERI